MSIHSLINDLSLILKAFSFVLREQIIVISSVRKIANAIVTGHLNEPRDDTRKKKKNVRYLITRTNKIVHYSRPTNIYILLL